MGLLDNGLLDSIQPTPRNRLMGLLSDALNTANDWTRTPDARMPGGVANPAIAAIAGLLGLPQLAKVTEKLSYGEPITNFGKANVPLIPTDTADAFMAALPAVSAAMKAAPFVRQGAIRAFENASIPSQLNPQQGAIVWHGSPHKFDKFDSSKIGTGEGAQAYGHGLYLAESPAVAKEYAGALSAARANKPVGNVDLTQAYQNLPNDVPETLWAARRDFRALSGADELSAADRRDFLQAVQNNISAAKGGALYKVDLPDPVIARMLNWDAPLSQQAPEVQKAVGKIKEELTGPFSRDMTGDQLLMHIQSTLKGVGRGSDKAESVLRQQGIPGIRYLDGGSRGAGTGTSNFVVFPGEESVLSILERNGVSLR